VGLIGDRQQTQEKPQMFVDLDEDTLSRNPRYPMEDECIKAIRNREISYFPLQKRNISNENDGPSAELQSTKTSGKTNAPVFLSTGSIDLKLPRRLNGG
jgi:hypothetical protein